MINHEEKYTSAGTNIKAVKKQIRKSGLSYDEAKEWIANTTGGRNTHIYSDTNVEALEKQSEYKEK